VLLRTLHDAEEQAEAQAQEMMAASRQLQRQTALAAQMTARHEEAVMAHGELQTRHAQALQEVKMLQAQRQLWETVDAQRQQTRTSASDSRGREYYIRYLRECGGSNRGGRGCLLAGEGPRRRTPTTPPKAHAFLRAPATRQPCLCSYPCP